mmetsp:Transcript_97663/g.252727  ORF Transcript_97663/g.252727 Transcript_97663/m.252727 type:complete len:312 (-) Transcript_97663:1005-1940(-)
MASRCAIWGGCAPVPSHVSLRDGAFGTHQARGGLQIVVPASVPELPALAARACATPPPEQHASYEADAGDEADREAYAHDAVRLEGLADPGNADTGDLVPLDNLHSLVRLGFGLGQIGTGLQLQPRLGLVHHVAIEVPIRLRGDTRSAHELGRGRHHIVRHVRRVESCEVGHGDHAQGDVARAVILVLQAHQHRVDQEPPLEQELRLHHPGILLRLEVQLHADMRPVVVARYCHVHADEGLRLGERHHGFFQLLQRRVRVLQTNRDVLQVHDAKFDGFLELADRLCLHQPAVADVVDVEGEGCSMWAMRRA